jgi:hypothetical protein
MFQIPEIVYFLGVMASSVQNPRNPAALLLGGVSKRVGRSKTQTESQTCCQSSVAEEAVGRLSSYFLYYSVQEH